jgi:sugar lactone lactonase YvrE
MAKKGKKMKKSKKTRKRANSFIVFLITLLIIIGFIAISKFKKGDIIKYIPAEVLATIGKSGEKVGDIGSPRGIAVSSDGFIYVADLKNNKILKFKTNGEFIKEWGKYGNKKGEFKEPSGVAVDKENFIYVSDAWNGRIQKFNPNGDYILEFGGEKCGFYSPRNVAVNKYGILFVADTGTSRIHRFDTEGNRIGNPVGGKGVAINNFDEVFGICFDSTGRIYAGDPGNRRIVVLSSDLKPLAQIKIKPWLENKSSWPMVAIDSRDYLYVVSTNTQDIYIYDTKNPKFKYIGTIKNDNSNKPLFASPLGIAIDSNDIIYVSDSGKNQVIKLQPIFSR